jgi:branched-chain amino acid transport system permease protein
MAFLGGRGTVWGPTLGALILVPAQQYLAYSSQFYLIVYAGVFLGVMLLMPRGILPSLRDLVQARLPVKRGADTGESTPTAPGVAT